MHEISEIFYDSLSQSFEAETKTATAKAIAAKNYMYFSNINEILKVIRLELLPLTFGKSECSILKS